MTTTIPTTEDPVRAVLHLRTLGPFGLNPPQSDVVDRLRRFAEDGPIDDLDIDVWGASMGVTQTAGRDPVDTRETVAEYERWTTEQSCTLRPAFDWRSVGSKGDDEERRERIVPPLLTPAVYTGETLQAVYPHVDDGDVRTIHDGIETLESVASEAEGSEDETAKNERLAVPP